MPVPLPAPCLKSAAPLEHIAMRAWQDLYAAAPAETARRLRLSAEPCGSALVLRAAHAPHPLLNRTLGMGGTTAASEDLIDSVIARYRAQQIPHYFIHLALGAATGWPPAPEQARRWLAAAGLRPYHRRWLQLGRGRQPVAAADTDLAIGPVKPGDVPAFGRILAEGLDLPAQAEPLFAALVGRPGWHTLMAFSPPAFSPAAGAPPVPAAAAAMFVAGDLAYLPFAATRSQFRNRHAQGALIGRRIEIALALGCRCIGVETGEPLPGQPSPSLHNLIRCGFTPVDWLENWCPPQTSWSTGAVIPGSTAGADLSRLP